MGRGLGPRPCAPNTLDTADPTCPLCTRDGGATPSAILGGTGARPAMVYHPKLVESSDHGTGFVTCILSGDPVSMFGTAARILRSSFIFRPSREGTDSK